jgi:hypothetical protein
VPYIVGVLDLPADIEKSLEDAVIVRIDESSQSIKLPKNGLTALPKFKKLYPFYHITQPAYLPTIEAIKSPVQYLHNYPLDRYYNPTRTTEKQWEAVSRILEDFQKYLQSFWDLLRPSIQPGAL